MNNITTAAPTVIDPICGMSIESANAAGSSRYEGRTYHFCSRGCEMKFDADPAKYAGAAPRAKASSCSCC